VKDTAYVVVSKGGIHKLYKGIPSLQPGQMAFTLNIEIPDEAFAHLFQSVELKLNEGQLIKPPINVEVGDPNEPAQEDEEDRR